MTAVYDKDSETIVLDWHARWSKELWESSPVDDRRLMLRALNRIPSVNEQLPVTMNNGSVVEGFDPRCSCGAHVPSDHFRGIVVNSGSFITVRGFSICDSCKTIHRFLHRVNNQLNTQTFTGERWVLKEAE